MPLLDLQLRLRQLGTLRMGEIVHGVNKKGEPITYPITREKWRITTSDPKIAAQVAEKFGGKVVDFESKSAEALCVDTDVSELPIAVVPGHALTQNYELWSGGGCLRRCDSIEEFISGGPCLCDPDSDKGRECKPTTRLSLVVRGIDALGLFRLNTGGWFAATELGGAVQFLEARTARGEALEGWLRIEERKVVRDGTTKVFKVPVLDVGYGIERMLPTPQQEPALTYKPLAALPSGATVAEGLRAVENPPAPPRTARSAAPLPSTTDPLEFGDAPVPVPTDSEGGPSGTPSSVGSAQDATVDSAAEPSPFETVVRYATEPQRRKIFAFANECGVTEDRLRLLISEVNEGNPSTKELPRPLVEAVLTAIAAEPAGA